MSIVEIPAVTDDENLPISHMEKLINSTKTVSMRTPLRDLTDQRQVSVTKSVFELID